jgi:RNA polymerase sigma factor (sigma-70 family)
MTESDDPIGALYVRAGPFVYRRCMKMLHNHERALDTTQWVFLRAIETGFEVRTPGESLSWLYRTATSRCLWMLRNERTQRRIRAEHQPDLVLVQPSAEQGTLDRDLLVRALQQVDERTGELVLLTFLQGFSNQRAAEICDVSTRTVVRARKQFEAILAGLRSEETG